jgi:hypothetical protein
LFNVQSAFGIGFVLEIKSLLCYGGDGVNAEEQVKHLSPVLKVRRPLRNFTSYEPETKNVQQG